MVQKHDEYKFYSLRKIPQDQEIQKYIKNENIDAKLALFLDFTYKISTIPAFYNVQDRKESGLIEQRPEEQKKNT